MICWVVSLIMCSHVGRDCVQRHQDRRKAEARASVLTSIPEPPRRASKHHHHRMCKQERRNSARVYQHRLTKAGDTQAAIQLRC
jgi:hypothetical protein